MVGLVTDNLLSNIFKKYWYMFLCFVFLFSVFSLSWALVLPKMVIEQNSVAVSLDFFKQVYTWSKIISVRLKFIFYSGSRILWPGIVLILAGQSVSATQMIVEELFLKKRNFHPLQVCVLWCCRYSSLSGAHFPLCSSRNQEA